ncbi:glycosyltransferase family 4 protein [Candidatus Beckwithbacteria bacterium]|nr:glycosyltransferase family 4 protein [Candidatus Beckwithbacteria bacterium]
MQIVFDLSSTQSGHKFRGIGFYTQRLYDNLKLLAKNDKSFDLVGFTGKVGVIMVSKNKNLYHFPAFSPFFFSFPLTLVNHAIITVHDLIPLQYPEKYPVGFKGKLRWQIQKYLLKYVKKIITDSQASKEAIISILGIKEDKIAVVYPAADKIFRKIEDEYLLNEIANKYHLPKFFLLYVGDLNWNKNVVRLAKIAIKNNLTLVVIGKQATNKNIDRSHPWNQELVKFQRLAYKNQNLIKCLGFVPTDDLVGIYNLATCFVYPSIAEGFGLPILEAMQCACPVITSDQSSTKEIAQDAALLINPLSNKKLEETILALVNDEHLRQQLAKQGLEQAKKFSWKKTAQQTLEVYKKVYGK